MSVQQTYWLNLSNGLKIKILKEQLFGFTSHNLLSEPIQAELVFQTGMTGYIESFTDPSYAGQIMVCTYPHQGNYGVPEELFNNMESEHIWPKVIIMADYVDDSAHYATNQTLSSWFMDHHIIGITGVDTRFFTHEIRNSANDKASFSLYAILTSNPDELPQQTIINQINHLKLIKREHKQIIATIPTQVNNQAKQILFIDLGAKNSQILLLSNKYNFGLDIMPYNYDFVSVDLSKYSGIFLSNGPGNPKSATRVIEFIRERVIEPMLPIPIFGICLGHQVLALAAGHETLKMSAGHRGQNIPVLLSGTLQGFITSQNHGFEVVLNPDIGGWEILFTNGNDGSCEGIVSQTMPWFSVQFHPEARPGPEDGAWLFDQFEALVSDYNPIQPYLHKTCNIRTQITTNYLKPISRIQIEKGARILILGSGGLQIGQAGEFDYSGSQAIKAYKELGYEVILINPNIATIQTNLADKVYYVPIQLAYVEQVIAEVRPRYISISFGGQTALNTGLALRDSGCLAKYGVDVLGTPLTSVQITEDRTLFKETLETKIGIYCPPGKSCKCVTEAHEYASFIGYPVLIRAGFCLGGQGSGFAYNQKELETVFAAAKSVDPTGEILIDKGLKGWKEFELELVRDSLDNCICVCAMENINPLGVHTGESIVVAPTQTLNDKEFQTMRTMAFKIIRYLQIVGECNIQFCLNPENGQIFVIEMNARLSRSSALASKATGYPLAYVAAKLGLGLSLPEITNRVTGKTTAFFEPALDYVVVKIPRWDLNKTPGVNPELGSAMKSVGEVMGIGRTFCEALMKAMRTCGMFGSNPLSPEQLSQPVKYPLNYPHSEMLLDIFRVLYNTINEPEEITKQTQITPWFINQFVRIINQIKQLLNVNFTNLNCKIIVDAKKNGFSDAQIAAWLKCSENAITEYRRQNGIIPFIRQIDTVAGEFVAQTNYLYLTYNAQNHDSIYKATTYCLNKAVIILGSGCYRIGSSVEFDWCAVTASKRTKSLGYSNIIINHNPETVSTDYDEADRLYFEEINGETVEAIYNTETSVIGIIVSMGGQTPNNIIMDLQRKQLPILGTSAEMIDIAENRFKFSRMCDNAGIKQPAWFQVTTYDSACESAAKIGYPVLVRPSYVLSGSGMAIINNETHLSRYLTNAKKISPQHPVVISKFIQNAKEIEVDAVALEGRIVLLAISEHVENAGVHSGDATLVLPAQDLTAITINRIKEIAHKIAACLCVSGPMNIQLIAKNDALEVIECNLRASRSFPFVSKTLGLNFIDVATEIIINKCVITSIPTEFQFDRVGVKVAQFSWAKLPGSVIKTSVEMASTGEVACFGPNRNVAFLKALAASGFKIKPPQEQKNIWVYSLLDNELDQSFKYMHDLGCNIIQITNTIDITTAYCLHQPNLIFICQSEINNQIGNNIDEIYMTLIAKSHALGIPLLTNNKIIKLFCESYYYVYHMACRMDSYYDVRIPNADSPQIPSHYPIPLPNHIISPSVIANSVQCISYSPADNINYLNANDLSQIQDCAILFTDKHILSPAQFNRNLLRQIFRKASYYMNLVKECKTIPQVLKGSTIGLLFYTPSTRTRCSFESAVMRLGGNAIYIGAHESSVQKGESFNDTVRTLDSYVDGLIIRTPNNITMDTYKHIAKHSIINAGDRDEHPTQALLDLFTIREARGTINNIRICVIGDCLHGRTVSSFAKLLCNYTVTVYFVPEPGFEPSAKLINYLDAYSSYITVMPIINNMCELQKILPLIDVVYMTRVQKERLTGSPNTCTTHLKWSLTPELLTLCKKDMIILHPLPRNEELPESVDMDQRALYFKQMEYGLYLRMALVDLLFSRK